LDAISHANNNVINYCLYTDGAEKDAKCNAIRSDDSIEEETTTVALEDSSTEHQVNDIHNFVSIIVKAVATIAMTWCSMTMSL
jgi:hypothetical protein